MLAAKGDDFGGRDTYQKAIVTVQALDDKGLK